MTTLQEQLRDERRQSVVSLAQWVRAQVREGGGSLEWGLLNGQEIPRGNSRVYLMARIERESPGTFRRCLRGKYGSVHEAAVAAGLIVSKPTPPTTPQSVAIELKYAHGSKFARAVAAEITRLFPAARVKPAASMSVGSSRVLDKRPPDPPKSDPLEGTQRQIAAEQEADARRQREEEAQAAESRCRRHQAEERQRIARAESANRRQAESERSRRVAAEREHHSSAWTQSTRRRGPCASS